MRHYEIVVMVSAEQFDRATAVAERYQKMVTDEGGNVHRFEDWGNRRLAYPIQKRSRARYFLFNIECGQETLGKLREDFRYSESVIRSLIIRRDDAVQEMSKILVRTKEAAEKAAEKTTSTGASGASGQKSAEGGAAAKQETAARESAKESAPAKDSAKESASEPARGRGRGGKEGGASSTSSASKDAKAPSGGDKGENT